LIPPSLPQLFTARELGHTRGVPGYIAQKMVYCLREMGVIRVVGRRKRAYLYSIELKRSLL
jgi:ribosomal protein S25